MVALTHLLFTAITASAAVLPRDAATIMTDIQTVNSDTIALTKAVKSYTGGLFGAIPVTNAESTLDNDIQSATTDAQNSAALTDDESQSIIDYINSTLEPNIESAISALEAKKSQFASAGLTSTVQGDLKTLKSDTDALGSALIAKAPADKGSAASAALAKIDADFAGAISYFA